MDFDRLPLVTIKGKTTPVERVEFVKTVNRVRHMVDVTTLQLHGMKTEQVKRDCNDPDVWGAQMGRRYVVELTGTLKPGEGRADRRCAVRLKFEHFAAFGSTPPKLEFTELQVGVVPLDSLEAFNPNLGDVMVDITRFEHAEDGTQLRPLAEFPLDWRQLVGSHAMAVTLASQ